MSILYILHYSLFFQLHRSIVCVHPLLTSASFFLLSHHVIIPIYDSLLFLFPLSTLIFFFFFFFVCRDFSSRDLFLSRARREWERERESQSVVQSKVWDGFGSLVVHTSRLCVADIRKSEGEADLADSCKPLPKVFFSLSLFVSRAEVNCSFILINCRRGGRRRRRKRGDLWFGTLWFREAAQLLGRFLIRLLCFGQKQKFLGQFFRLPPSQLS